MKNSPFVSVIVPCYNHEKFVAECLLSVLNQTYSNLELIVIDDGSTDDSVIIIKELQKQYDFLFIEQENIGLSATLNKAIKTFAKGEYIAILASDDFWHPDKLQAQIDYFDVNPTVGMVFTQAAIVDQRSVIVDHFNKKRLKEFCTFEELILDKKGIPALTVIIKKNVFDVVGLFDEDLLIEDWDMWLRIVVNYKIGYVKKELAYYRIHDSNMSSKLEIMLDQRIKILKKWQNKYPRIFKKSLLHWQKYAFKTFIPQNQELAKKYLKIEGDSVLKFFYYYKYSIKSFFKI